MLEIPHLLKMKSFLPPRIIVKIKQANAYGTAGIRCAHNGQWISGHPFSAGGNPGGSSRVQVRSRREKKTPPCMGQPDQKHSRGIYTCQNGASFSPSISLGVSLGKAVRWIERIYIESLGNGQKGRICLSFGCFKHQTKVVELSRETDIFLKVTTTHYSNQRYFHTHTGFGWHLWACYLR